MVSKSIPLPPFVSFNSSFRAHLNASASALIPEEAVSVILREDPEKKTLGIIPEEKGRCSGIKCCGNWSHRVILISIGEFIFERLGVSLKEIKFKRFKITKEEDGALIIHLTKQLW